MTHTFVDPSWHKACIERDVRKPIAQIIGTSVRRGPVVVAGDRRVELRGR